MTTKVPSPGCRRARLSRAGGMVSVEAAKPTGLASPLTGLTPAGRTTHVKRRQGTYTNYAGAWRQITGSDSARVPPSPPRSRSGTGAANRGMQYRARLGTEPRPGNVSSKKIAHSCRNILGVIG